jgi:peroxiredoxin family protein
VKELKVKIVKDQDKEATLQHQIMQKILNASIQVKSKKKNSKYIPTLIKHKSEADIFRCLQTKR